MLEKAGTATTRRVKKSKEGTPKRIVRTAPIVLNRAPARRTDNTFDGPSGGDLSNAERGPFIWASRELADLSHPANGTASSSARYPRKVSVGLDAVVIPVKSENISMTARRVINLYLKSNVIRDTPDGALPEDCIEEGIPDESVASNRMATLPPPTRQAA